MNKKVFIAMLSIVFTVLLVSSLLNPASAWLYPDESEDTDYEKFGPRADRLIAYLYTDEIAEFNAFETGAFDLVDWPLPKSYVEKWQGSATIDVVPYGSEMGFRVIDLNNNEHPKRGQPPHTGGKDATGKDLPPDEKNPVYPNPMGICSMRHAIWHCMDRAYVIETILEGYGVPIYTHIPPCYPNYMHPDIKPGGALEELTHPYNITEAKRILDEDGFYDTDQNGWRNFPTAIGGDGKDILLKFYIRSDDALRRQLGLWLADQIEAAGVRVDRKVLDYYGCYTPVMLDHDFHIYTGGWGLTADPDHLTLYQTKYYWYPGFCYNYPFVHCPEFDYWVDQMLEANTYEEAKEACYMAQEVMAGPCCYGNIPVWTAAGFKAIRRCYSGGTGGQPVGDGEDKYRCQPWAGVINVPSNGPDQDFNNLHPEGHEVGDGENMTIRWGFKVDKATKLNPVYAEWTWDWNILDLIYNSLLARDDYTFESIPNLAKDFEVGTWVDPETQEEKSKVKFNLRSDVFWHDGVPFSAADVIWSMIEMPKALKAAGLPPPWWQSNIAYIQSFYLIDPCNIEILLNVKSVWAVGWIGGCIILPKHVWKPLIDSYVVTGKPDITGFSPDPHLIGSSGWRYVEYVEGAGGHHILKKNVKCRTITTTLKNELGNAKPVHQPSEPHYFTECPVHVNVHTLKEYKWVGGAEPYPPYVSSQWHQYKGPEICTEWHLDAWVDNGDGVLSQCDKVLLSKKPQLTVKNWEHVYYYDEATRTLWTDWYAQKLEPGTEAAFGVSIHNQWLNPVPYTEDGEWTGEFQVTKDVYLVSYGPPYTEEPLVSGKQLVLPACEHNKEIFNIVVPRCHYAIKAAVHITGPEYIIVWKEQGAISIPNPWVCWWQIYSFDFWGTIKQDITGAWFDSWHGKKFTAPGGTSPDNDYMVPCEVSAPDCKVRVDDVLMAALAFGSQPGHPRWNSVADINGDYKVRVDDILSIALKFGW